MAALSPLTPAYRELNRRNPWIWPVLGAICLVLSTIAFLLLF